MFFRILGKNWDIIKINHYEVIKAVSEYSVHESLESSQSIGEAKMHDKEVKGTITSLEGGLPLVAGSYLDEIISAPEVDLGVNAGTT